MQKTLGVEDFVDHLQIQEAGMVHENQTGLLFQLLDALALVGKAGAGHAKHRQQTNQHPPKNAHFFGALVLVAGAGHHLVVVHVLDGCFHNVTSLCLCYKNYKR